MPRRGGSEPLGPARACSMSSIQIAMYAGPPRTEPRRRRRVRSRALRPSKNWSHRRTTPLLGQSATPDRLKRLAQVEHGLGVSMLSVVSQQSPAWTRSVHCNCHVGISLQAFIFAICHAPQFRGKGTPSVRARTLSGFFRAFFAFSGPLPR